jgi:hypothetical protein
MSADALAGQPVDVDLDEKSLQEFDFPDGGVRAWGTVFGVRIAQQSST